MNNSTSNTPAVSKSQHVVRDEQGRFAGLLTSERELRQQAINRKLAHWQWLNQHGYANVEPSELFAGH